MALGLDKVAYEYWPVHVEPELFGAASRTLPVIET